MNGSVSTQVIADVGVSDGNAFDWVYRNIYWTDANDNTINVASWDGNFTKTLIDENLEEPRAIVVDPREG